MSKLRLTRSNTPETMFEAFTMFADELERRIAFGTGQWTWDGISPSASVTVTHELANTPTMILLTPQTGNLAVPPSFEIVSAGATTFVALAETVDGSTPAGSDKVSFYWLAIV